MNILVIVIFLLSSFSLHGKVLKSYSTTRVQKQSQDSRVSFWTNPANIMTAHGAQGTLGHMSPLGFWGPYGNMPFNATMAFKVAGDWSEFAKYLATKGGPLSPLGPTFITSFFGQLFYNNTVPNAYLLAPGGALSIMGNAGVWSPLGMMGPFGPNGAHGYASDSAGNYLGQNDQVVREIKLWGRTYPLYEFYRPSALDEDPERMDTSFVVEGVMGVGLLGGSREYIITSAEEQWIHINTVNLIPAVSVTIKVFDMSDNLIEESNDYFLINFVALYVEQGTKLKIKIRSTAMTGYRLFVTGAQSDFDSPNPDGPHILKH
jgi:hypothetical protein